MQGRGSAGESQEKEGGQKVGKDDTATPEPRGDSAGTLTERAVFLQNPEDTS